MTMSPPAARASWWKSLLVWGFALALVAALIIGWFRTEGGIAKWVAGLFLLFCGVFFTIATFHDWLQIRRLRHMLYGREPLEPESFGTRYFSDLPRGPEIAAATRRLLDAHVGFDLGGLRPDDPLDCLQDWLDPIFLDELGRRLGIAAPSSWEEYQDFMRPLRTVRDLVDALTRGTS